jgi:CRISPR/Cas system CSM-associated protein Csm3 (group 7 of RAMP superfamily)
MPEVKFKDRWLIEGRLTTLTPLRIGNGDVTEHDDLKTSESGEKIEIAAVATDVRGCAYIPATTIKGRLRAWAQTNGMAKFEDLFGSSNTADENAVGGKVEFHDAFALSVESLQPQPPRWPPNAPYWRSDRLTGVAAGVAIDRRTRTASDEKLFHHEFVPPGVSFTLTVAAQNLDEDEPAALICILNGLNHVALGAATGDGWGRVKWELTGVKRIEGAGIAAWISSGCKGVGYDALSSLNAGQIEDLKSKAAGLSVAANPNACISLDLRLEFESNFLVNDPSQVKTREEVGEENAIAHAPLLDAERRAVLPSSSIRGALRNQAERILRTIGGEKTACYIDDEEVRPMCDAVYVEADLKQLCPACQIFGANGWRSPISFTHFTAAADLTEMTQEFLAIDRFTGGGAEGAKFNAKSVYRPQLCGSVTIDLKALERAGVERWALGLLLLTFKDLIEGDVRLGFGAAKGYGAVRAKIEKITLPDWNQCAAIFKNGLSELHLPMLKLESQLDDGLKEVLRQWVDDLNQHAKTEGAKQ